MPFISVILAMRDEEKNIWDCLCGLVNQDYPKNRYEIIVINDRSMDKSPQIVEELKKKYPLIRSLHIETVNNKLTGKQNALHVGIKTAKGEWIMCTDADCWIKPSWISNTVKQINKNTGFIFGNTSIEDRRNRSIFNYLQT
ncbi:MAG: glycosyltransferase, partial [bacterium]